ncbi:MAG: CRP-like cAMP-binding protein [Myxococcota bacterium]
MEARLRRLLVDLAKRYGVRGDARGLLLDVGLTRGELAGMAGTALETVIRTINHLRDADLVIPGGRRFFIADLDALKP